MSANVAVIRRRYKPRTGTETFCGNCGKAAIRRADARRREKIIEARRLYAEGNSAQEIAKELNVRSTVRRKAMETVFSWVGKGTTGR